MIINGLRIPHPVVYRKRETERPRVSASPSSIRPKRTVTARPADPRAIHAMPMLIPIVMAIGSIAAGAAGAAALVAGTVTLTTVLAGAMVVGGAMTLIGAATGNQNLMKYGGILSAVGGLGTAAVGMFGGAEALAGGVSATEAATSLAVDSVEAAAGGAVADMSGVTANVGGGAGLGGGLGGAAEAIAQPGILAGPGELASAGEVAGQATTQIGTEAVTPFNATKMDLLKDPTSFQTPLPELDKMNTFKAPDQGGGILDWVNKNKEATKIGVDALSGLAKGAAQQPLQEAQIGNYNASSFATRQAAARAAQKADWGRGVSKPLSAYLGG